MAKGISKHATDRRERVRLLVNCETNQDTLAASCYCLAYCNAYMNGEYDPHYPMPAKVDVRLGHCGDSWSFCRQCAWLS